MSGRIVIACYKPKSGKEEALEILSKKHVDRLKKEDLVTDRKPILMRAKDGTVVEIFEWKSEAAIKEAHENTEVQKMWEEYSEVCEYVKPINVAEFQNLFSEFEPLN